MKRLISKVLKSHNISNMIHISKYSTSLFVALSVVSVILSIITGCSDDECANINSFNGNAINFVVLDAPATRASELQNCNASKKRVKGLSIADIPCVTTRSGDINSSNFKTNLSGFHTYGFNEAEFKMYGNFSFENKEYTNNGNGQFSPKTVTDTAFWTNNMPINVLASNFILSNTPLQTDTGVMIGTIKGGDSDDLLLAYSTNQTKASNNGTINLYFKHLLSKINLYIGTSRKDLEVEVSGAGISNLCGNGKIYLKDGVPTIIPATVSDSSFAAGYDWQSPQEGQDLQRSGYVRNNDVDCYVLPLNSTPWDYDTWSIDEMEHELWDSGEPLQTYLWIYGKIRTSTGLYLVGNERKSGYLYWPFNVTLQPAHTYNCYMDVPYGLTSDGDTLNLDPLDYRVGNVITSEGHTFGTCVAAVDAGETPCGMIVYVGSDTGDNNKKHGLAISLEPLNTGRWYENDDLKDFMNKGFIGLDQTLPYNCHWIVPSKKQFETIFIACGGSSSDFGNLDKYLSNIDDVQQTFTYTFSSGPDDEYVNSIYWTSDNYAYRANRKAWSDAADIYKGKIWLVFAF